MNKQKQEKKIKNNENENKYFVIFFFHCNHERIKKTFQFKKILKFLRFAIKITKVKWPLIIFNE